MKRLYGTLFAATFLLSGCNSLFYHPDDRNYGFPNEEGLRYKTIELPTEDSLRLSGWEIEPEGPAKGTVLHFHGNAENMTSHFRFVAWLARNGYRVITFDYRGYGKSAGKPSREGLVLDGVAALHYARSREPAGLFVVAQSLGGAVAVPAIVRSGVKIDALILESTFGSYRAIAREKLSEVWITWPFQWPLSFLVSNDWSPEDYLPQIGVPLLMLHGDADPVVSLEAGRALFDRAASKRKEFCVIPGRGHTPAFLDPRSEYRGNLLSFIAGVGG